ncbi:hypothetical protein [Acidicapsa acidisoli]|uniref:hypothetical protein n=1 Tax=Acidicapsa acidisoli TaxID=1615681 RepID=UPI0021E0EF06|nr:hypothetical protein [Acidicapsa acidisoli]
MHEKIRFDRAWTEYDYGSIEKMIDDANDRIHTVEGGDAAPAFIGPNYKKKRRQKSVSVL